MSAQPSPRTILLIHGLWMTPRSWEHWIDRYSRRGHRVLAPAWPGMEADVERLLRDPSPMTRLGITKIVDHYDGIIRGLDSPPIIVGHSAGGLFVQLLIDRGLASAGVGVGSGAITGVVPPLSTIRATFPVLGNPFNRGKATSLTAKQFHYAFCNTLSREESDKVYERQHVAAANRVMFQIAFAIFNPKGPTRIDFKKDDRAPILFIAFDQDHLVPVKASRHSLEQYRESKAITAVKEFAGRPHFPAVPGWEEVADYALDWATSHARKPVADG
jgi:pimeloyl-ACP methyl ester carboxylesterase